MGSDLHYLLGEVLINTLEISRYTKHSIPEYKKKRKKIKKMLKRYEDGNMKKYVDGDVYV